MVESERDKYNIDDSLVKSIIREEYGLPNLYIEYLNYHNLAFNFSKVDGYIEYSFVNDDFHSGLISIKDYLKYKRNKNLNKILN